MLDGLIPQSFSHGLDLNLGCGCHMKAFRYRKQAAQNTSKSIVNRRVGSTLNPAGQNHLWWRQSRAQERSKQLTAHVDIESRARQRLNNPVAALVKVLAIRMAPRKRHHHFLENDNTAGTKMVA